MQLLDRLAAMGPREQVRYGSSRNDYGTCCEKSKALDAVGRRR